MSIEKVKKWAQIVGALCLLGVIVIGLLLIWLYSEGGVLDKLLRTFILVGLVAYVVNNSLHLAPGEKEKEEDENGQSSEIEVNKTKISGKIHGFANRSDIN